MSQLDAFLHSGDGLQRLAPVLKRILDRLAANRDLAQAWEALPPGFFGKPFPAGIVSCWAFALRAGGTFTSERHPNSWQRSIGIRGDALFEVHENGRWEARPVAALAADGGNAVSIPPNVWHRIKIGQDNFLSISFHTAPASELIEETCVDDDFTKTQRRLYQE